jgi:SET domain-containing protein
MTNTYIKKSTIQNAGYGVFAEKDYKKGDIVHRHHFIYVNANNKCNISNYYFDNPGIEYKNKKILPIGNLLFCNHSVNSNINPYNFYYKNRIMVSYATKDIKKNEELFINYGPNYNF